MKQITNTMIIVVLIIGIIGLYIYNNQISENDVFFEYTHFDGEKYNISLKEYNFPLSNQSKCDLMNQLGDSFPFGGISYKICSDCNYFMEIEVLGEVNGEMILLYTVSSCGDCDGYIIDEDSKTIEYRSMCSTTD